MTTITASQFKLHLFDYLDKVEKGETIVIERYKQEIARLIPSKQSDWRDKMRFKPNFLVSPEQLIAPIEDIWEAYT